MITDINLPCASANPTLYMNEGVLHVDFGKKARVTRHSLEKAYQYWMENVNQPVPILAYGNRVIYIDYDAIVFASHIQIVDTVKYLALIAVSPLEKLLAQMFLQQHRPPYPAQHFDNKEAARHWLLGLEAA